MTELAIQVQGVDKAYRFFKLRDIRLELEPGQILGFVGPNGAGKSTTIRILMALVHQDRGEVRVLGRSMPREQAIAKRDIGYMSEDMRLYGGATLAWHMAFVASAHPDWDEDYAQTLLRRFHLHPEQPIKVLSHGERTKATLLLVLARRPRLLLLDEPTTGLDPVARHEILAELTDVMSDERRSILFSSQNTRPDHVLGPRSNSGVERQGDVRRALAPAAARCAAGRHAAVAAGSHRAHGERPASDRHDQRLHGRSRRCVYTCGGNRARGAADDARGDLRRERHA